MREVNAVGVVVECRGKILLLKRHENDSEPGKWCLPGGSAEENESLLDAAKRELKEETGLDISIETFPKAIRIRNRAIYYYVEMNECDVTVQDHIEGNDANGIGWIKPNCLEKCIENGNITLSQHCRIVFSQFMNRSFPHSTFILVEKKIKFRPI